MSDTIRITPAEVRAVRDSFNTKADETKDLLTYLRSEVASLEGSWEGAAKNQFTQNFDESSRMLDQVPEGLNGVADILESIAKTLEELDEQLASQIRQ